MVAEDQVTARLMIKVVADFLERCNKGLPRNAGKPTQMFTSTISSPMEGGIGSPCFLRLSMYPVIASWMF